MTRGLNRNFNGRLKDVFKGAATTVIQQGGEEPLYLEYLRQLDGGTKPNLAKVTLARKIASTALSMWKAFIQPEEVLRTGWFPRIVENKNAMTSEESRSEFVVM